MADPSTRKKCLKELLKCADYTLPDIGVPPWNLPLKPCQEKKSSVSSLASTDMKCRLPRSHPPVPSNKQSPLSQSFKPTLNPSQRWNDYHMGDGTLRVPMSLFAENRKRLCDALRANKSTPANAVVFLQGGTADHFYNTDIDYIFRQEPYFHWAYGVTETDCYGAIVVRTGETILFVPRLPDSYATWMGPLKTLDDFKKKYEVTKVSYSDQIKFVLQNLNGEKPVLLLLQGKNTDSGLVTKDPDFDGIKTFNLDYSLLYPVITELRVFKTAKELEVLRYTNRISSEAHKLVMRNIRPGMKEYQCESIFLNYCYYTGGARHVSYTCICGTGTNSAILHYGHAEAPNDKKVNDGDICCFDMGCNYYGYASDITCSYPVNGKFTPDQKLIYNAVLAANRKVFELAKPGVSWVDMHRAANETMLECLKAGGLLKGDVKDMMDADLAAIFQPHGLGHFMGIDVHDVGGYMENTPSRPVAPGFDKLRTARVLQPGMVITVEPGCYFVPWLLDKALENPKQRQFLVPEVLERFRNFGGIRIEDDVVVTETGLENLTNVPRTIEEIEEWMAKTEYAKTVDSLIHGQGD